MSTLRRLLLILALAPVGLLPAGCVTNEATGRTSLSLIGEQEEISIGEEAQPEFIQENGGEIPSTRIRQHVSDLGMRLAAVSERPHLPWEFHVLDSSVVNAFALPGGKVFISRGLLERMSNEAQLAGVLGHEIGHVTAQHVNSRMSQAILVQGIAIGAGVAGQVADEDWLKVLGVGAQVGGGVYLLSFSREQESESDMLGVRYMTALGYHPRGQVQLMQILKDAGGGGGGIEWLATHPLPDTRIERLSELIADKYPDADSSSAYTFAEESFENNVLRELADLPPPRHAP